MIVNNEVYCPHCKNAYGIHLKDVRVFNSIYDEGPITVRLNFDCELGHTFKVDLKQHEGYTIVKFLKGGETDVSK